MRSWALHAGLGFVLAAVYRLVLGPYVLGPALGAADMPLPLPPTPSQMEPYGFAGVIFAAFLFLVSMVLWLGWKFFGARDRWFMEQQEKRDVLFRDSIRELGISHEKVVERVTSNAEKVGDAQARAQQEVAAALREARQEIAAQGIRMSEETIRRIVRDAVKEVKSQ